MNEESRREGVGGARGVMGDSVDLRLQAERERRGDRQRDLIHFIDRETEERTTGRRKKRERLI